MRRLLLFLILGLTSVGWAQNARYDGVIQARSGLPAPGAKIAVCLQPASPTPSTTVLCTNYAPLCSSVSDVACTQPNPITADGLGNYFFYVLPGYYTFQFYGSGLTPVVHIDQNVGASSGGGSPGAVLLSTASTNQSVGQPSTGGATLGTSFNSNVFEQVRYADQFQWSQSPSGAIAIGVNTITINGVRGINQYSFSPGLNNFGSLSFVVHMIWIAGTGTPEAVTISGSTCIGASIGTCTITFTAANSHAAGYTIGTATAGFQEALVDTFATSVANTNLSGWTIKGSSFLNTHNFVMRGTLNLDEIKGVIGGLHLDCEGATLEDGVRGAAMIKVGGNSGVTNIWPSQTLIDHCHFGISIGNLGRAANGTQVEVLDASQGLTLRDNNWDALQNGSDILDYLVDVAGDQNFDFERNTINSPAMLCDTTFCGWMIYGDPTNSAALGTIANNYMNGADAFNWESGNGLTIFGNVFQNWKRYPWRYRAGLAAITNLGGNYYEGSNTINPDFGVGGYSNTTGPQVGLSGTNVEYEPGVERGIVGLLGHRFSSTGANGYTYYIVGHDGGGHSTKPLFIGDALSDGATNFTILFLQFGAATYDVLRSGPAANDGTDAAPYGTGNWAVSTGIVCAANPCSFTETFAAPTAYTVAAETQSQSYTPTITYWPVPLFISGVTGSPAVYHGPGVRSFVNSTNQATSASYYDGIFTSEPGGTGNITGMRILHLAPLQASASSSNKNPGAMILNPDAGGPNGMINRKGRINMPSLSANGGATWSNNLLYQAYDSEPAKTMATAGHQPFMAAADCGMGYDTNQAYLAFMCGQPISFYVNHVFDSGTSPVFQLLSTGPKTRLQWTSTLATGTAPFSVTSTTPVANLSATPTTYNAAGTQQVNAHVVEGTCTLGTNCAITLTGSAAFTGAGTYACTAQDTTAAAAVKVVQASGSSVTFTGTGTDVLVYSCVGN